jgi:ketosteroid isomerase-like protein
MPGSLAFAKAPAANISPMTNQARERIEMSKISLEERIQRLEDIEAIKDLTARYASAVNKGWNGREIDVEAMPSIYAEDARWDSDFMGVHAQGLEVIMAGLPESTAMVEFSMHSFLNPTITIDGDGATGNWLMWIASKVDDDPRAVYLSADLTYTRTVEGWRIQSVNMQFGMILRMGN